MSANYYAYMGFYEIINDEFRVDFLYCNRLLSNISEITINLGQLFYWSSGYPNPVMVLWLWSILNSNREDDIDGLTQ